MFGKKILTSAIIRVFRENEVSDEQAARILKSLSYELHGACNLRTLIQSLKLAADQLQP